MKRSSESMLERTVRQLGGCALALMTGAAVAATAQISNNPLAFQSAASVRPNLLFILDDSGSMDRDYIPEGLDKDDGRCFGSSTYNKVFFHPSASYLPPVNGSGGSLGSQTSGRARRTTGSPPAHRPPICRTPTT